MVGVAAQTLSLALLASATNGYEINESADIWECKVIADCGSEDWTECSIVDEPVRVISAIKRVGTATVADFWIDLPPASLIDGKVVLDELFQRLFYPVQFVDDAPNMIISADNPYFYPILAERTDAAKDRAGASLDVFSVVDDPDLLLSSKGRFAMRAYKQKVRCEW